MLFLLLMLCSLGSTTHPCCRQYYTDPPIIQLAKRGDIDEIKECIRKEPKSLSVKNFKLESLLHCAVSKGYKELAKLLIRKGIYIDIKDGEGKTPLHVAAQKGRKELAKLLIKKGANIKAQDKDGWTPLHFAVRLKRKNLAKLFIEKGADIEAQDKDDWTPLFFIARWPHIEIAKLLLQKGANIHARDKQDKTVVHATSADENGYERILEFLIEQGALIEEKDNEREKPLNPLDFRTFQFYRKKNESSERKALFDILPFSGNQDLDEYLIEAVWSKNVDRVEELIRSGACPNTKIMGSMIPLLCAASQGDKKMVKVLLELGANRDAKNESGWTALHFATCYGHLKLAKFLIKKGIDPTIKDSQGHSAQDIAANKDEKMLKYLKKASSSFLEKNTEVEIISYDLEKILTASFLN